MVDCTDFTPSGKELGFMFENGAAMNTTKGKGTDFVQRLDSSEKV